MKCPNCGTGLPDNAKFCGSCGSTIEQPSRPAPVDGGGAAPKPSAAAMKKFRIPAVCAVAAILLAVVAWVLFKPSKYAEIKGGVTYYQSDGTFVFVSSSGDKTELDSDDYPYVYVSLDGEKAAFVIREDDTRILYYSDGGKPKQIAEAYGIGYKLAPSGDAVAFTARDDGDDYDEMTLSVYSGGKVKKIADEVYGDRFCISPDGKTVVYAAGYDEDDGDFKSYIWDGNSTEIGENKNPIAVSNGGKLLYYYYKSTFYVQKGKKDDTRQRLGDGYHLFNRDLTEVISYSISENKSTAYISRNGGERQKLSGGYASMLVPATIQRVTGEDVQLYGVSSFDDTFYLSDSGSIVRITGKYAAETIAKSVSGAAYLADDGKTIIYIKGSSIYKANGLKSGEEAVKLAGGVEGFIATSDGGAIFYYDDSELFYLKGSGKVKALGDIDVSQYGSVSWGLFKGKTLYYADDGELRSTDGNNVTSSGFTGIDGEVTAVWTNELYVSVTTDDDGDYAQYISRDGKSFELIAEY